MKFKPMLAAKIDAIKGETVDLLKFPLFASPKIDGIRCTIIDGVPKTRSLKDIPNRYVRGVLSKMKELNFCDGEIAVDGNFNEVTSAIMSEDGKPDFTFNIFDNVKNPNSIYIERLSSIVRIKDMPHVKILPAIKCRDKNELEDVADLFLSNGYEGAIARSINGLYKFGRSTFREGGMVKIKPFEDAEAVIIGFEEQYENTNEPIINELGLTERSSHADGKIGKDTLGSFVVLSQEFGEFRIGTGVGLGEVLRKKIWTNKKEYVNKISHVNLINLFRF